MAVTEQVSVRPSRDVWNGGAPRLLVTDPQCPTRVVEAYHTLYTNVDLALGPQAGRMIAVASIDATADSALVAANLALITAQSGDRTLLVDGNVQEPALDGIFGVDPGSGLAQLLDGEQSDLRALTQPTMLPTLGVIAAGTVGARHHRLDRQGDLSAALLRLKNAADRVILVTAPVLASTDVVRLGEFVDGVILALTPGRTGRAEAARAHALLNKAQTPVLGAVLTPR